MAPMSFLRAPYDGRASSPDMTATAEAAVVMSPELALVDPALRAVALEQLEAVAIGPTSFAARASRRAAAGAAARQRDADDSRVRVDRGGRRHHYVLAASLLANVFLIGIIVSGFPSRSSSVAHERTAASTPSVDAAAAGADGVVATESTAQSGAGAGVFVPALRASGVTTTTRPSDPRDSEPPVERAASTAPRSAGAAPGAARAATRALVERPATVPVGGTVGRTVPRANDARNRPSTNPGLASGAAAATARLTRSRERAERDVLEFIRRSSALRRFVDPSTKLVKANVSVQCTPTTGRVAVSRSSAFTCHVWQQPRPRSTGATVVYAARKGSQYAITLRAAGTP